MNIFLTPPSDASELRDRALRYRKIAEGLVDERAVATVLALADELGRRADEREAASPGGRSVTSLPRSKAAGVA